MQDIDQINSSFDDTNPSNVLTWVNSDLYNFRENASHPKIDRKPDFNQVRNYSVVDHNQGCLNESQNTKIIYKAVLSLDESKVQQKEMYFKSNIVDNGSQDNLKKGGTTSISSADSPDFSIVPKQCANSLSERCFVVNLYIETKASHMGPLPFEVHPKMCVRLLKLQVEKELGIPAASQKWIIKNTLVIDSDASLSDYGVTPTSSIFLYVDSNFDKKIDVRQLSGAILNKYSSLKANQCTDINNFLDSKQFAAKGIHRSKYTTTSSKIKDNYSFNNSSKALNSLNIANKNDKVEELMSPKQISKINSFESLCGIKCPEIDTKCKILTENFKVKSLKDPQVKNEKLRKIFLKAKFSNGSPHSSSEKILHSSSSDMSEKSYFENNYAEESPACNIKTGNVLLKSENFVDLIYNKTDVSKFATAAGSNDVVGKHNNLENSGCLKNNLNLMNLHQSSLIEESPSECNKPELSHYSKDISKPKKSFLQQLKLKQRAKEIEGNIKMFKENVENSIENNTLNIEKCVDSEFSQVVVQGFERNPLHHRDFLKIIQLEVADCISDYPPEKESNFGNAINETENKDISIANENAFKFEEIPKNVHTSINTFHDANELPIAEISIQSDANNTFLQTSSELSTEETIYPECQNNVADFQNDESAKNYQFLLRMENSNLVRNVINFTCPVCFGVFESDQGVVLHECLHTFCLDCLRRLVEYAEEALIKCPYRDDLYSCQSHLQQREIRALVPGDVYEKYLQRSITTAESLAEKSFHCKTPDCPGWCMFEDSINVFHCPVCNHYNCLNCMALHEGLNCRQYQDKLMQQKKRDPDAEKTIQLLNKMIESGKAVKCPKCDLILMKKWGCDWLKCSVCLTEICWITKGPRWGPAGQGDTSAGCRCGVNGIKCHPSCTYCH